MLGTWVLDQNLRPFLQTAAALAGYELEEDDWTAIEYGLFKIKIADDQHTRRVDYPLSGKRPLTVKLEKELGTSVVSIELTSDASLEALADGVALVIQTYEVHRRTSR
jgi:hypothetical protein